MATSERISAPAGPTSHAHLSQDVFHATTAAEQLAEVHLGTTGSTERVAASLERITASSHAFELGAELVVHFAFFWVAQCLVSLLDFLELFLGTLLFPIISVFMQVRVIFPCQLFVSFVNLVRRSAARQSKNLIVVVCH